MKSLKKNKTMLALFLLAIGILPACKKLEFDKLAQNAWNPNLAIPLAHANFGVYDILARQDSTDIVVIDNTTGAIALVYKGEVVSYDAQSIVQLNNQTAQSSLSLADLNLVTLPALNGTISTNNSENITFNTNAGVEIHTVDFSGGTLNLALSTTLQHDVTAVLTFPDLKLNNVPISRTINLTYTGEVPQTSSISVDLANVIGDFTLGNTTVNTFKVTCQTTITGTGQPVVGNENIQIDFNLSNLAFENVRGYFGQQNLGISNDTILMRIFETASTGYFELINPKVKFIVENSFGFPSRINFSEIKTINIATGQEFPLSGFPTVFDVNAPSVMGQTATSTLELNTTNTPNLATVITPVPKYFYFAATAQSNPGGQTANLNFIEADSKFRVRTEVELPLEGLAYGFELKDTVPFNFNEDVSAIESVMFRINVDNGFPVDFKTQLIFLDQNYSPLFTIFNTPEAVVQSALVDNSGKVNQNSLKITDATLNEFQISQLNQVKYVLINGVAQSLDGTNGQIVKFYDSYRMGLKLGMQIQGKVGL
jgi:hypothetical protein